MSRRVVDYVAKLLAARSSIFPPYLAAAGFERAALPDRWSDQLGEAMLGSERRGLPIAYPLITGGALRKANRRNEKRIFSESAALLAGKPASRLARRRPAASYPASVSRLSRSSSDQFGRGRSIRAAAVRR